MIISLFAYILLFEMGFILAYSLIKDDYKLICLCFIV